MKLPVGIYVVSQEFLEQSGTVSFTFKGVAYEAQMGVNAFVYLEELSQTQLEKPAEPFCGYSDTPIVILPAGVYKIGNKPYMCFRTYMPCALTILGENAGVSPNSADLRTPNPDRKEESVVQANFYYGCIAMQDDTPGTLTLDGLELRTTKVFDERRNGGGHGLVIRNCTFTCRQIRELILADQLSDPAATRFVHLQDVRADGIDALNGEGQFIRLCSGNLKVERLYFANNEKFVGLTDYRRTLLCARSGESCTIEYWDSLFENCACPNGFSIVLPEDPEQIEIRFTRCQFLQVTPKDVPLFCVNMPNESCSLSLTDCTVRGDHKASVIQLSPNAAGKVDVTGTDWSGYTKLLEYKPPRRAEPDAQPWQDVEDPHEAVAADFALLNKLYEGRQALHGDFHTHTNSGGTSDGKTPLAEFVQQLKALKLDFAAVVDHRQMRHFFLPEWDEQMLIPGTEPGTYLQGTNARYCSMDYTMIFPDKTGLAKVFETFPEYQYTGGTDGYCATPRFEKKRLMELGEYIWSIGGLLSHAHPKQLMASDDPLDYYLGENVAIETVHADVESFYTKQNRDLWVSLLKLGKRVTTHGSSDTHREAKACAQTTVYAAHKYSTDIFNLIRSGDCAAGAWGIQMTIDGCSMGSSLPYRQGQTLLIRAGEHHEAGWQPDTVYCLKVYTDQGLAYAMEFDGKTSLELALPVKKRKYYRVEITNESDGLLTALGNPIWLDYKEEVKI